MIFTQNNLSSAQSPYLRQHAENPVWWQEWKEEVLDAARRENKPLFVSVGYATCHWCHVMANESFQDHDVAAYLNDQFISIKVDREQRPDIDQYLMAYITSTGRQGGWPLNCFLTPDLKPFFALTYAPLQGHYGSPGFLDILKIINDHYKHSNGHFEAFTMPADVAMEDRSLGFVKELGNSFDLKFGGFGYGAKFPPHNTLLFMLYYTAVSKNPNIEGMLEKTLDSILLGGLHDHLQGGFFRYCVDREWHIPHFEKMLYDQAMLLWVFSLACRTFRKGSYHVAVEKIIKCLGETFEDQNVYYSGHDADTDHQEGASYLWSLKELSRILTPKEYAEFSGVYRILPEGNFEGRNHLRKEQDITLKKIEAKLLDERKKRAQPFVDRKIITSWNCLTGIGLIHAHRYAGARGACEKAEALTAALLQKHWIDDTLAHSSFDGLLQKEEFLQDHAAMLLLLTYLHEETGRYAEKIQQFYRKINLFRHRLGWMGSSCVDFLPVFADSFDHPVPSSLSLVEFALLRADILLGADYAAKAYRTPLNHDFYNLMALMSHGYFHVIETSVNIRWDKLPINSLQKTGDRARAMDCYHGSCQEILV